MKIEYKENKDNVLNEVYNFFIHNYDKYINAVDERKSYNRYYRFEYDMFDIKLHIDYIYDSSDMLIYITIKLNYTDIHKYVVGKNYFDKKYRFFKKFISYFDEKKEDEKYTTLYEKIKSNKPLNVKRTDKIKNILK